MTSSTNSAISLSDGAKAGFCVGPFWVLANVWIEFMFTHIFSSGTFFAEGFPIPMVYFVVVGVIAGMFSFAIVGVFFVRFLKYLPGYTLVEKGMFLTLMIWAFLWLRILAKIVAGQPISITSSFILSAAFTLMSYATAGAGLGFLVEKFSDMYQRPR